MTRRLEGARGEAGERASREFKPALAGREQSSELVHGSREESAEIQGRARGIRTEARCLEQEVAASSWLVGWWQLAGGSWGSCRQRAARVVAAREERKGVRGRFPLSATVEARPMRWTSGRDDDVAADQKEARGALAVFFLAVIAAPAPPRPQYELPTNNKHRRATARLTRGTEYVQFPIMWPMALPGSRRLTHIRYGATTYVCTDTYLIIRLGSRERVAELENAVVLVHGCDASHLIVSSNANRSQPTHQSIFLAPPHAPLPIRAYKNRKEQEKKGKTRAIPHPEAAPL